MRSVSVLILLGLLSPLKDCKIEFPQPSPSPTVAPTPEPTVPPIDCRKALCPPNSQCIDGVGCVPIPEPTNPPTPEPTAPPTPGACTITLTGSPVMGAYFLYPKVVDSTPKITSAERCNLPEVGYPGRISCPVCFEGCDQRFVCEVALMGGVRPSYELEVYVTPLAWDYQDDWKARVYGSGKGRIRSCFPNGKACSKWLEIQ